ncbi:MAG: Hpt domain-containing protein [Thaumarchaeota archaeon]|nr:Hpt domain-containing protein [Nitrososphaerota archaeon]
MSDEFLKVAKQEIQSELDELERITVHCNDDERIFKNSQSIKEHIHKIRGLAPMIGQDEVGEIATTSDYMLKYIINKGPLSGSCSAITKMIDDMKKVFHGLGSYDISNFKKTVREKFPQIPDL